MDFPQSSSTFCAHEFLKGMDSCKLKRHHYVPHSKFTYTGEISKYSVTLNENSLFLTWADQTDYVKLELKC